MDSRKINIRRISALWAPAAIARPLGAADRKAPRALSARVRITAMSFANHDEWGDFKGNPQRPMERSFGYCQVELFGSEGCSLGYFPDHRNKAFDGRGIGAEGDTSQTCAMIIGKL